MWTWITAADSYGTDAILAEASSDRTVARFLDDARRRDRIVGYVSRPCGVHWDGGRCDTAMAARLRAGIRRNNRATS